MAAAVLSTVLALAPATASEPPHIELTSTQTVMQVHGSATPYARNLTGAGPSAYRGWFYRSTQESYRLCVGMREASFGYRARGGGNLDGEPGGDYGGTYQLSPALQRGVTWMLYPELRSEVGAQEAKRLTRILRAVPAEKWNRYWQDAAFYTILNWRADWSGRHHWAGGRWTCSKAGR